MKINMQKVYVLMNDLGHYKIGKAKDVEERKRALQSNSSTKLHIIRVYNSRNASLDEKSCHHLFRNYKLYGEWFDEGLPISRVDEFFEEMDVSYESYKLPRVLYLRIL